MAVIVIFQLLESYWVILYIQFIGDKNTLCGMCMFVLDQQAETTSQFQGGYQAGVAELTPYLCGNLLLQCGDFISAFY